MPEISILCLIGLPAAGKTYLASLITKNKLGYTDILLFCYDDIIKWNSKKSIWKEERNNILSNVEDAIINFLDKKESTDKLLIVLDDNMFYRSMRYAFYKLARKYRTKFCQIYVKTSLITCLIRNCNRDQPLPTNHILNVNEKMEVPSNYNSWEKNTLTLSGEENIEQFLYKVQILFDSAGIPEDFEIEKEPTEIVNNTKHTADLALRQIISLIARETKNQNDGNISEKMLKLNKKRNEIMKLINSDKIQLPSHENIDMYIKKLFPIMTSKQSS